MIELKEKYDNIRQMTYHILSQIDRSKYEQPLKESWNLAQKIWNKNMTTDQMESAINSTPPADTPEKITMGLKSVMDSHDSKNSKIRAALQAGYKVGDIKNHLGLTYQRVKNIKNSMTKKSRL